MNFFDKVNGFLFSPLSGKNKRIYIDVLLLLYDRCSSRPGYSLEKSGMIDEVENYFLGYGTDLSMDDDDQDVDEALSISGEDAPRMLATAVIRRLKKCGWLIEREGDYDEETTLSINHIVIPVIRSFDDVINPKTKALKGKLFGIYTALSKIESNKNPYENCLKPAEDGLRELNQSLKQLDASIEEHVDALTKGKGPEEVLDLADNYEERVVVASYHRFKTDENISNYRSGLYDALDKCEDALMDALTKDCADAERMDIGSARIKVAETIQMVRDSIAEMRENIALIDMDHIEYRTRAQRRAQFLLLADGTAKSKINLILRNYANSISTKDDLYGEDDTLGRDAFRVYSQQFFDEKSLQTPYQRKVSAPISEIDDSGEEDMLDVFTMHKRLLDESRMMLSPDNVNRFADELLGEKPRVSAAESAKDAEDAITKLVGLFAYSQADDMTYMIHPADRYVIVDGVRFRDFLIERKTK